MDRLKRFKQWINENAPMLSNVYENKYVGMAYDRFASLPPTQQRSLMIGSVLFLLACVLGYLASSYAALWSYTGRTNDANQMIHMVLKHQKSSESKSQQLQGLEGEKSLSAPGALKSYVITSAKLARISQRLIIVTETPATAKPAEGEEEEAGDSATKQVNVKLEKVNLNQLKEFLEKLEHGRFTLSITSITINNDDKIRGYMNVNLNVETTVIVAPEDAT